MLLAGAGNAGAQQQALNGQEVNLYLGQFKNGLFHGVGTEHEYDESGQERAVRGDIYCDQLRYKMMCYGRRYLVE